MNSSLTRYKSAPSSYFANLVNKGGYGGEDLEQLLNPRATIPETERIFPRFVSETGSENSNSHMYGIGQNSSSNGPAQSQIVAPLKRETEFHHHQQQQPQQQQSNNYASGSRMIYQSQSQAHHDSEASNSGIDNSYRLPSSLAMDGLPYMKMGGGSNSNLIRHSSSPAGLFSHINVENGYGLVRGMESFGPGDNTNAEASFSSTSRLKGQMDISSGLPSSSGLMSHTSEIGSKNMVEILENSPGDGNFGEGRKNHGGYITGFPITSWDDSAILSDDFLKGVGDNDRKVFCNLNASENQNGQGENQSPTMLSRHLSLPTSSAEMEKLLQLQDSIPCKIRAKRGCATHPRSIAERVRRTRISERMRKLQELVPNMDKQTNTSDMLDLAVNYIKGLQKQVQTLSDNRAKCTCPDKEKP
ncbi:unnamed protein product [Ilex paraguariensis]|uniref:BHLH domain-containing protein n=1 Tax=Ilex paraguariensis TaxID=185542 RepID=A0ABC8RPL3_9AQUA